MPDLTLSDASASTPSSTIISTWGSTSANCYITLSGANDWIQKNSIDYSVWSNASNSKRTAALLQATRDIDSRQYVYFKKYGGDLTTRQILEFPRSLTPEGSLGTASDWYSTVRTALEARMESDVKAANCLQALYLLEQDSWRTHLELSSAGVVGMSRKVGPIEESYRYGNPSNTGSLQSSSKKNPLCAGAMQMLSDWLAAPRIVRG